MWPFKPKPKPKRKTAQRGYGGRWQRERLRFLKANPLCVMCHKEGRITPATVVDHIIPHKGDDTLMWDSENNWQPLCKPHHDSDKQSMDKGGKPRRKTGPDGWPEG